MDFLYEAKDELDILAYKICFSIHIPAPMLLKDHSQSLVHFQHEVCPPSLPGLADAHGFFRAFDATRNEPVNVGIHLTIGGFVEMFTSFCDYSERISTIPRTIHQYGVCLSNVGVPWIWVTLSGV